MRLENKVAIITGGANGIGKAVVDRFAAQGAKVAIWDVDDDSGKQLQEDLNSQGRNTFYQHVDVSNPQEVNDAVSAVVEKWSQIDVLVNNAGILRDGQLVKFKDGEVVKQMTDEMFDLVININLKGVFNCTRAVAPTMIAQKSGAIISASSIVGLDGNFGQTNYVATKAGVIGMTKVWARELGRYGIRVNASVGNNTNGVIVPIIWVKSRNRVTRKYFPIINPSPISVSHIARIFIEISG